MLKEYLPHLAESKHEFWILLDTYRIPEPVLTLEPPRPAPRWTPSAFGASRHTPDAPDPHHPRTLPPPRQSPVRRRASSPSVCAPGGPSPSPLASGSAPARTRLQPPVLQPARPTRGQRRRKSGHPG